MKHYVIKRDGRKVLFDGSKILKAVTRTTHNLGISVDISELVQRIATTVQESENSDLPIERLQDIIENTMLAMGYRDLWMAYSSYRKDRTRIRDLKSELMETVHNIGIETDRDNANVGNNFSSKLLRIASETNKWHNLAKMPKYLARLHEQGDLYYHDLDSYNLTINCLHIDTGAALRKGFNTGYGTLRPPKRIEAAAELSCILLQSTQNDMFGGQSHVDFDNDLAAYVEATRSEIWDDYRKVLGGLDLDEDEIGLAFMVENKLIARVHQAMQGIVYNLNTMHSRAGSQVPFSSLNIGLPRTNDAALICQAFLEEYEKGLGKHEQPIFPNIIFRVKDGVNKKPGDPYYYLFELACRVTSTHMNPTYMNMDADFNLAYYNRGIIPATMGCRTYICSNINGPEGPAKRGNIAPATINLPRLGIRAQKDLQVFWKLLDERLLDAKEALLHRYSVLCNLKVKDLPFIAGEGLILGSEKLGPNDSIRPILENGSWAIGFIGLAETLTALTGEHHGQSEEARELGYKIIQHIRDFTDNLTKALKLNFSCYATPAEGLSGKFVIQDRKLFGIIPGVTDKEYYTNSFHVPVGFGVSVPDKLSIEAPYHKLCNGGHISYLEMDGYPTTSTVKRIIDYAYTYTNINYIGINFHLRYCKDCGKTINEHSNTCPECGSHDIQGISRVTGYLSLDERFGVGKAAERRDRQSHNGTSAVPVAVRGE